MKRTYQIEIEFPGLERVEDWKVQSLIASQIENAKVVKKGTQERIPLKVTGIEMVSEEETDLSSFVTEFIQALTR